MRLLTKVLLATAAVAAAPAPAASADTLLTPAPGARNLTGGGGYLAWAAPSAGGRWRLTIRTPGGEVSQPAIADFATPPRVGIGSTSFGIVGRRTVALYERAGDI